MAIEQSELAHLIEWDGLAVQLALSAAGDIPIPEREETEPEEWEMVEEVPFAAAMGQ